MWKSCLEPEHREVGVAEARERDLSCFEKSSGLLSFRWVLQMLLVMARRKPVPPQQLPEPYTVSFSVGQIPGEGWRVPGSS